MFFDTRLNNHNLRYNPFKACVVPRPIGWISTVSNDGVVNLAPYSYFNAVSDKPPVIMFSSSAKLSGEDKDSVRNIEQSGEFVFNVATYDLREQMSKSSNPLDYGHSEVEEYRIETTESMLVKPPRVKLSPVNLECKYIKTVQLEVGGIDCGVKIIFGHVIGIHISDTILVDGKVNIEKLRPITRLGYDQYAVIDSIFTLEKQK